MTMGDESLFAAMAMPVVMSPILEKVSVGAHYFSRFWPPPLLWSQQEINHVIYIQTQYREGPAVNLKAWFQCPRLLGSGSYIKAPSHQASASTDGYVPQHFRHHATLMLSVHKTITFTHGQHWGQYASTAYAWQCQRSVWMGLKANQTELESKLHHFFDKFQKMPHTPWLVFTFPPTQEKSNFVHVHSCTMDTLSALVVWPGLQGSQSKRC